MASHGLNGHSPSGARCPILWMGVAVLVGLFLFLPAACGAVQPADGPRLRVDASVAPDFQALAEETWTRFLAAFPARIDCMGEVTLVADPTLADLAAYHIPTATVRVKVPGAAARLQAALVHEWAHHLEHVCPAHRDLRPAFLQALGLPPDTPWFTASTWEHTPSEIYAETAVELVLGHRAMPTKAHVPRQAVEVLRTWAEGGPKAED